MKLASAIAKLPIISVSEGEQTAAVCNLLVGRKSKKVEFLSVNNGAEEIIANVVAFGDIKGIGNDYIVVSSSDNIVKPYVNDRLIMEIEDCILLNGKLVLSLSGDVFGAISDFALDEKTGAIVSVTLDNQREIEGDKLVTLSSKFVVVDAQEKVSSALDEGSMAYLVGKTVRTDVASEDGAFTIKAGTALTQELIVEAEANNMLVALTMAV